MQMHVHASANSLLHSSWGTPVLVLLAVRTVQLVYAHAGLSGGLCAGCMPLFHDVQKLLHSVLHCLCSGGEGREGLRFWEFGRDGDRGRSRQVTA